MANKIIVKGNIGNALHSVAPDHIVTVADEIFDEELQMYQSEINRLSGVFDISTTNATGGVPAKYTDLAAALGANGANVPEAVRKGGMSVKFIRSSDSKYAQYRLMLSTFTAAQFATVTNWQSSEPVQEKGQSVTDTMSQKAITDLLNSIDTSKFGKVEFDPNTRRINFYSSTSSTTVIGYISTNDIVDLSNYYTKSEVDSKDTAINNKFSDYYTKTEVDDKDAVIEGKIDSIKNGIDCGDY